MRAVLVLQREALRGRAPVLKVRCKCDAIPSSAPDAAPSSIKRLVIICEV